MIHGVIESQIKELSIMESCVWSSLVQICGICALVALAISAMVLDGTLGETIVVAVAGGIGLMVGFIFPSPINRGEKS